MAYKLERAKVITYDMTLGEETLTFHIKPFDIMRDYQIAEAELIQSRDKLQAAGKVASTETAVTYGQAIVRYFEILFGKEVTAKILAFFENNYSEMCVQVFPFIVNELKPKIDAEIIAIRQMTRDSYKKAKYGDKWNYGAKVLKSLKK